MSDTASVEAKILALKTNYINSLPDKLSDLQQIWLQYKKLNAIIDTTLESSLHRLAGSAGMYDVAALGALSRSLELVVADLKQPLCTEHILIIEDKLAELEKMVTELHRK